MKYALTVWLLFVSVILLAPDVIRTHLSISSTKVPVEQVIIRHTSGDGKYKFASESTTFKSGNGNSTSKVSVNEALTYQRMDGFGAAITDSSAWNIYNLPPPLQADIMSDLFSPAGIRISYVRVPMGASDFVIGNHYTYDDMPVGQTDPQLNNFSIQHDQSYIIPIIQEALLLNPNLKIMASPWSAPAWMKTPQTLYGGSLNMNYCQAYANYFVKFIQAYKEVGIPIEAVTVQNEPNNPSDPSTTTNFPTMHMGSADQTYFVKNCLGPAFALNGIQTKIIIWDHNWDSPDYPLAVLSDPIANSYIDGSAWHCYAGLPGQQSIVYNTYKNKNIYFTECTGHGPVNFAGDLVWGLQNVDIGSILNWSQTVIYWNLVLDENYGPHNGGCSDCRGLLTIGQSGVITTTPEYYIVGHLSKFIDPGAYHIGSNSTVGALETIAFKNPDQSITLVVVNSGTVSQDFDVLWDGKSFPYNLESQSVATFQWHPQILYLPYIIA